MSRGCIIIFSLFMICLACTSQKKLVYFQGDIPEFPVDSIYKLRLNPGDILSIDVFTINYEAYPYLASDYAHKTDNNSEYEKGYVMNSKGEVQIPLIGSINLSGLTIEEATIALEKKFKEYIEDPIVTVRKINFKVTVIGEVNKPGNYTIMSESATLPEVLGMAGDLSQFADRQNLRIIRTEKGKKTDLFFDLTKSSSLSASTYYLQPDDVLYVQPMRRKAFQSTVPSLALLTSFVAVVLSFILVASK